MRRTESQDRNMWKGLVAGAAAGLAATWAMTEFQKIWSKMSEEFDRERHNESLHSPERGTGDQKGVQKEDEDATMKTADRISRALLNRSLSRREKELAAPVVHYGFGSALGAVYGALAESVPKVTIGQGSVYGSAVFILGDEIAVPAMGLSGPVTESPISVHIYAWLSHLVYGLTLENVRRGVRGLISDQSESSRSTPAFREAAMRTRARRAA